METEALIVYSETIPPREAIYADYPAGLLSEIGDFLKSEGIRSLYCHQAQMFERSGEGKNVVITTSTASGKTLGFLLPVIQAVLKDPAARVVFLYPTKALAADQYRALEPWIRYFGEGRLSAGVYDADTPAGERSRIRRSANIILTNPEMLNAAFLPNHSKYGFDVIFSNLKYIVIDELHTYRGAFGSHLANVFRRVSRVCRYYHSDPQYLCSSATIANPVELAQEICGKSFWQVERDGSPAPSRRYLLLQPPAAKGGEKTGDGRYFGQTGTTGIASHLLPELVEAGTSFIAFARSRRTVEVILKEARDHLAGESMSGRSAADKISGYRGGYTPGERREIEKRMLNGSLLGLVSTNALELGIDIGKIDATVLAGYPGTRASFWQQTGRAGRSGRDCTNYLILDNQPFDQYIAIHPEWLFEGSAESAVVDKNNLLIQLAHIRAASAELPLTLDDMALFPDLGETIPVLMRAGELTGQGGRFMWSGTTFPAGDYSLRNVDRVRYRLLLEEDGREITQMDELQAYREIHTGAVYLHDAVQYQVVRMDRETRTSFAVPFQGNYYTVPGGETDIRVIRSHMDGMVGRVRRAFGDVNVIDQVYMYKKLQYHNHQNLGNEMLASPLTREFDTESMWLILPQEVVRTYRRILKKSEDGHFVRDNYFEGLCFALQNAAMMATMTEKEDIGVVSGMVVLECSADSIAFEDCAVESGSQQEEDCVQTAIFLYDKYVGGLGYAQKAYELLPEIANRSIRMISGCTCESGCVACVGDYHLDKRLVLWGLKSLLEECEPPDDIVLKETAPATFLRKRYAFRELPEKWQEFCRYLQESGESYSAFLSTIPSVDVQGNCIRFHMSNAGGAFSRSWILEEPNRKSLQNLLRFHTDAPAGLQLGITAEENPDKEQERTQVRNKLSRRLDDLKK